MPEQKDFKTSQVGDNYWQFAERLFQAIPELKEINKPNPHRSSEKGIKVDIFHPNHPHAAIVKRELDKFCKTKNINSNEFKKNFIYTIKKFDDGSLVALSNRTYFDKDKARLGAGATSEVTLAKQLTDKGEINVALKKITQRTSVDEETGEINLSLDVNDDNNEERTPSQKAEDEKFSKPRPIDASFVKAHKISEYLKGSNNNYLNQLGKEFDSKIDNIREQNKESFQTILADLREDYSDDNEAFLEDAEIERDVSIQEMNDELEALLKETLQNIAKTHNTSIKEIYAAIFPPATFEEIAKREARFLKQLHGDKTGFTSKKTFTDNETLEKFYLFMPLGRELFDYFSDNMENKRDEIANHIITIQMLEQLQGLHEQNLIHADVKSENFVISLEANCILLTAIDLGLTLEIFPDKGDGYTNTQGDYTVVQYKTKNSGPDTSDNYYLEVFDSEGTAARFGTRERYGAPETWDTIRTAEYDLNTKEFLNPRYYQSSDLYSFLKIFKVSDIDSKTTLDFSNFAPHALLKNESRLRNANPEKRISTSELLSILTDSLSKELQKPKNFNHPYRRQAQKICGQIKRRGTPLALKTPSYETLLRAGVKTSEKATDSRPNISARPSETTKERMKELERGAKKRQPIKSQTRRRR